MAFVTGFWINNRINSLTLIICHECHECHEFLTYMFIFIYILCVYIYYLYTSNSDYINICVIKVSDISDKPLKY